MERTMNRVIMSLQLQKGVQEYSLPKGTEILALDWTPTGLFAWYMCDPDVKERDFRVLFLTSPNVAFANMHRYKLIDSVHYTAGSVFLFECNP
jgi:hypothetical protein